MKLVGDDPPAEAIVCHSKPPDTCLYTNNSSDEVLYHRSPSAKLSPDGVDACLKNWSAKSANASCTFPPGSVVVWL